MSEGTIFGIHPVLEALGGESRRVSRILVAAGRRDRTIARILQAARQAGVPVRRAPRAALDRLACGASHQGVIAWIGEAVYAEPEAVLARAAEPALVVVLDGVEDPRNLGAVIRAAAGAGADGVFLPERGTPDLTASCAKASAGAVERIPIARIGNVVSFLKSLKDKGIWVAGLDPGGETPYDRFDLTQPVALVLGAEGRGLRRLARETCDVLLGIPLGPGVESLNLAVAAAVVLFEAGRQRRSAGAGDLGRRDRPA